SGAMARGGAAPPRQGPAFPPIPFPRRGTGMRLTALARIAASRASTPPDPSRSPTGPPPNRPRSTDQRAPRGYELPETNRARRVRCSAWFGGSSLLDFVPFEDYSL